MMGFQPVGLIAVMLPSVLFAQTGPALRQTQRVVVSRAAPIIESQGLRFKDLDRNGILDPYEDWPEPIGSGPRPRPSDDARGEGGHDDAWHRAELWPVGRTRRRSWLRHDFDGQADPRHHFQYVLGASVQSGRFSQWPEALGLAAIRDVGLVRHFADIARQEYRAVGIYETLSPQADLA